ncbi:hypothetical protein FQN51_008720 [Onygenales sp. PD_10]|nr:hypothetical protein FQN51_008720 [Onygenales sp. PD_10]
MKVYDGEITILSEDKEKLKDATPVKAEKLLEELMKLLCGVNNEIDMKEVSGLVGDEVENE